VNVIELVGALVQSELKYTPSGLAILEATLAGKGERACYHRVTIFGKTAEAHADTPAGTVLHVVGRLDHQRWEKNGEKRSAVKVIADVVGVTTGTVGTDAKVQAVLEDAVNVCTLAGNLTRDPETRDTSHGEVTNASIAINETRKGEEYTHYIDVTRWNRAIPGSKGDRIIVVGELRTRSFEDRGGTRQYRTEVTATRASGPGEPLEAAGGPARERLDIDTDDAALPF